MIVMLFRFTIVYKMKNFNYTKISKKAKNIFIIVQVKTVISI